MIKFLVILALSGCSYSTHYLAPGKGVYPPRDSSGVAISSQQILHSAHQEIGPVSVIVWGDGEDARKSLQKEAARVGGNAVIRLRLEKSFFYTSASGLAVLLHRQ